MDNQENKNKKPSNFRKFNFSIFWMYGIILAVLVGIFYFENNVTSKEVSWSEF